LTPFSCGRRARSSKHRGIRTNRIGPSEATIPVSGDCVVFNSRILHGGSGRLGPDVELRVFTSKWLGDDVRVAFRNEGMDPDFSSIMTEHGLVPGDRPGTDLLPRIWSAIS
jgi:hypothetical protein